MTKFEEFTNIIKTLRSENGCPWDREQTHVSLKPCCIEEAAEVICGINTLEKTGDPSNLKEELGDLLMQIVLNAQIAEEEGYFTMDDVVAGIINKMIRRHPHVFGNDTAETTDEVLSTWAKIKETEAPNKSKYAEEHLNEAFDESIELIAVAKKRKGFS